MTYPAWFDLHSDEVVVRFPTVIRVYARLLEDPTIFDVPRDVKAWSLAIRLGAKRRTVTRALRILEERGYMVVHGRGCNNVRRVTLTRTRAPVAVA
jgi:DNA-binding MarR family transcriptional regulator